MLENYGSSFTGAPTNLMKCLWCTLVALLFYIGVKCQIMWNKYMLYGYMLNITFGGDYFIELGYINNYEKF